MVLTRFANLLKNYHISCICLKELSICSDAVPEKIAIDTTLRKLFYTDSGRGEIGKMDFDGENSEIILNQANNIQKPVGITLDIATR